MNDNQAPTWSQGDQLDPMVPMQDIDFSNFLDIGDIDLTDFPTLDNPDGAQHGQLSANPPFSAEMQRIQQGVSAHDFGSNAFGLGLAMDSNQMSQQIDMPISGNQSFGNPAESGLWPEQASHHQATHMPDHAFMQHHSVPPTPNSYEMHGNPGPYMQQHDAQNRAILDQRYRLRKDDAMAFTPLVSPAVTPQDSHFQQVIPEYTTPGAYFSPLTSPALQAQNATQHPHHHQYAQSYYTNPSTANSSLATSPVDLNLDVDMLGDALSLPEPARKSKRKAAGPRSAGPSARVRQSPIVKPQKRKNPSLSSVIPPKTVTDLLHGNLRSQPHSAGLVAINPFADSSGGSGAESVSPEPLSESIMGPPPKPTSSAQSPAIAGQSQSAPPSTNGNGAVPATPGSIMHLKGQKASMQMNSTQIPHSAHPLAQTHSEISNLDELVLPPAADTSRPPKSVTGGDVTPSTSADATPRLNARKTPKLGPLSTPSSAALQNLPQSAISSPSMSAMASPVTAATPSSFGRKPDAKSGKVVNKKRGSVGAGSALVSPALRPKISPSIKPLLPEGASLSETQHALLLASKSNYTHLLEGTSLPGVSYPESLSSGLTSKRTSHKIAEQGRRNRINEALKEMQTLLPGKARASSKGATPAAAENGADEDDEKDSPKTAEGKSANSKAATVESAIEYIRVLQEERKQTAQALKKKDEEMEVLRKKLMDAESKLGAAAGGSSTSESGASNPSSAEMEAEQMEGTE